MRVVLLSFNFGEYCIPLANGLDVVGDQTIAVYERAIADWKR